MTADRIWVLGASDPEMEIIESILRARGERVEYATVWRDGVRRRVTPAEAYAPDVEIGAGLRGLRATAYMIECAPAVLVGSSIDGIDWAGTAIMIDHHRPGDPGYGRPPSEFFEASSIGQVVAELARLGRLPEDWKVSAIRASDGYWFDGAAWWMVSGDAEGYAGELGKAWRVPHDLVLTAAADHCLAAAYRGECPGVDPDELMRWRAETRAAHQGRPVGELLADVERAREALRAAPTVVLDGISPRRKREEGCPAEASRAFCVRDMRGICTAHRLDHDCGCATQQCVTSCGAYSHGPCSVPELPDAASRDGVAYIATVADRDGRKKVVLGGKTTPEQVRAFLDHWAPAQGLMDIYGDPARGFAGGYLPA